MSSLPTHFNDTVQVSGGQGWRAVAAGTGDNTEVVGAGINRMADGEQGFDSMVIAHAGSATLAEDKTLKIRTRIQESLDGSSWDAAEEIEALTLVATGGSGGTTEKYERKVKIDLIGRKQHIRILTTPDLDAANTDVGQGGSCGVLGGATVEPV